MRKRIAAGLVIVAAGISVLAGGPQLSADEKKAAPPKHLYGHDLRVRPGGKKDFGPDTPRIGIEMFHDEGTQSFIAISEKGAISVAKAPLRVDVPMTPKSEWKTAHDLHCRKAGEAEFTKDTTKWGVEMFEDRGSNNLVYVCESGSIAITRVPPGYVTDRGPKWHHALEPKVRTPEQASFDNAKKIGIEIFKDENTNGLLYITETGAIAAGTTTLTPPDSKKIAAPKPHYGLDLRVRGADEPNFSDKTKRIGVEVFEDPNANTLFYITEGGYVAAVPFSKFVPDSKGVTWRTAMSLRARKGGQANFADAKKFGIEVFEDNRTGNLIFISETGSIAVLPK